MIVECDSRLLSSITATVNWQCYVDTSRTIKISLPHFLWQSRDERRYDDEKRDEISKNYRKEKQQEVVISHCLDLTLLTKISAFLFHENTLGVNNSEQSLSYLEAVKQ